MSSVSSTEFKGTIGRTWEESKPWWLQPTRAPADAPLQDHLLMDALRNYY